MAPWKPQAIEAWHWFQHALEPYLPGALGALVAQMWESGLSLKDRLMQWAAGLTIAVYVVPMVGHVFGWGQPIVSGVGFVFATFAFKAVGAWRKALIAGGESAFEALPNRMLGWLPWGRRTAPAAPPADEIDTTEGDAR